MEINDIVQDAIAGLIEADQLMTAFPEDQQRAWRALVSGLVGVAQAVGESHERIMARLDRVNGELPVKRLPQPLSIGME